MAKKKQQKKAVSTRKKAVAKKAAVKAPVFKFQNVDHALLELAKAIDPRMFEVKKSSAKLGGWDFIGINEFYAKFKPLATAHELVITTQQEPMEAVPHVAGSTGRQSIVQFVRVIITISHPTGTTRQASEIIGFEHHNLASEGAIDSLAVKRAFRVILNLSVKTDKEWEAVYAREAHLVEGDYDSLEPITQEQADRLKSDLAEIDADMGKFLNLFQIDSVDALPASQYQRAFDMVCKRKEQIAATRIESHKEDGNEPA